MRSDTSSSHCWLTRIVPLRSRAPSLPPHYKGFNATTSPSAPWTSHRYSAPRGAATWRSPFASRPRFPRSPPEPALSSRRLYAGHRSGRQQAPPELVPVFHPWTGFDDIWSFSTRRQRFTCVRLLSTYLTSYSRCVRLAHHPDHWARAAAGGLDPGPAPRVRGAAPHLVWSKAASSRCLHQHPLVAPSWRTDGQDEGIGFFILSILPILSCSSLDPANPIERKSLQLLDGMAGRTG